MVPLLLGALLEVAAEPAPGHLGLHNGRTLTQNRISGPSRANPPSRLGSEIAALL